MTEHQQAEDGSVAVGDAADTRTRVARDILQHGPSTAATIAERLELTTAAVRRHLDSLTAEGLLEAGDPFVRGPRGRGRPAKVYKVTDQGRDAFEHAYDDLAASALGFVAEIGGPEAVAEFARRRLLYLEEAYRLALAAVGPDQAPQALTELLTEEGYAASVEPSGNGGLQICQHHCPVAHVAAQYPQLCEAETEMIGRLLGTHVQRLATIAHGDGVCTTHIPPSTSGASPGRLSGSRNRPAASALLPPRARGAASDGPPMAGPSSIRMSTASAAHPDVPTSSAGGRS
jgi:predicted ArsR family transcriptional regulator